MGGNDFFVTTKGTNLGMNNCAMNAKKTTTLNLRVDPLVKDAVRYAANQEHRSVANMVEMMIRQYCRDAGYPVLEQNQLFDDAQ